MGNSLGGNKSKGEILYDCARRGNVQELQRVCAASAQATTALEAQEVYAVVQLPLPPPKPPIISTATSFSNPWLVGHSGRMLWNTVTPKHVGLL